MGIRNFFSKYGSELLDLVLAVAFARLCYKTVGGPPLNCMLMGLASGWSLHSFFHQRRERKRQRRANQHFSEHVTALNVLEEENVFLRGLIDELTSGKGKVVDVLSKGQGGPGVRISEDVKNGALDEELAMWGKPKGKA